MKTHFLATIVGVTALLFPLGIVYGQNHTEYLIQITSDGSADWLVKQTGIDIKVTNNTIAQFESKIASLVDAVRNETDRNMTASTTSITITPSGPYTVVEYRFYWSNFSIVEKQKTTIGDVFLVESFFLQLYGDGEIIITYPQEYVVVTVTPTPYEQSPSLQTLKWLGTTSFGEGQPAIVLGERSSSGVMDFVDQNALSLAGVVLAGGGFSAGFYVMRRYRKKRGNFQRKLEPVSLLTMQTDEEQVTELLRSSGGSMYQSAIAEKCKFSKAKTSQLLTALEGKRVVNRVKRGRDKIVVLTQQGRIADDKTTR